MNTHLIKKEIMDLAGQSITVNSPIRLGQAVFNAAHALYPHQANKLRGTSYDPFYADERIDAFLDLMTVLVKDQ